MEKYFSLTIPVTLGPLESIGSALVKSTPFEIVSLVEDALARCTSKTRIYNLKNPTRMRRSPHLFVNFSLGKSSFLDCSGYVPPADMSIHTKFHLSINAVVFKDTQKCSETSQEMLGCVPIQ